eukprot:6241726-Amphidinium_carterae.2
MSDIQSAFLNTPVQPGTTILVKPRPECGTNDNILNKQLYGLRDSPQKFELHLSSILNNLVLQNFHQTSAYTMTTTSQLWSTWMTYYALVTTTRSRRSYNDWNRNYS